jgi:competence protein ComGC
LVNKGYLKSNETNCPNGDTVEISTEGVVSSKKPS